MGIEAVIVAAGAGRRMASAEKKTFLKLDGVPVLIRSLLAFQSVNLISRIVVVVAAVDIPRVSTMVDSYALGKVEQVIAGGSERQDSVWAGIQAARHEWVLIHDGARPLIRQEAILRLIASLSDEVPAATLGVPVKDTIKRVDQTGKILETLDRKSLWAIQTPQAFQLDLLKKAHLSAKERGWVGTDDASLVEKLGHPVQIVMGDYANIKITTPEDLDVAVSLLRAGGLA
jgi:2-C-methyl-D-erythritol 4-phosphate cytidylyltransferase